MSVESLLEDPIGRYPATTVACFDPTTGQLPRRDFDGRRNIQFLQRLAASGVGAVLIAASTGQGHLRTVDELAQWFRSAADADLGTTIKMALLRPEDGPEANDRLLGILGELSYAVVFVRPGTNLPPQSSSAEVARNMLPLVAGAAARGMAVGVYSIPDVSGLPLTADAAAMLLDGPGGDCIVAVKVTEPDFQTSTLRFLRHPRLSRLKIVQGWDPLIAQALQAGPRHDDRGRQRCGVTSGPMSLAVFQYQHIFAAADRQDWNEVQAAQQAVTSLFQAMQDDPRRFADLQRAKYIMGLGQPLTADVSPAQVDRVFAALEQLPRQSDRQRLARSLDLMQDGPFHQRLLALSAAP